MLVIRFGVRKDNLEVLNSIVNEAVGYGVWSVFYSDETGSRIEDIKNKINKLYKHSLEAEEGGFQLEFDFQEAQVLKKVIIFYLTNNFQSLTSGEFESITDFILLVDEILEFELEGKI